MAKPESYEVTEYGDDEPDVQSVISQVISDRAKTSPAHGITVSFSGDRVTFGFHCYEMHLPTRIKQVTEQADDTYRELVSLVKKEFKRRTKRTLALKELKDMANYTVQKVSLNERYYMIFSRSYELKLS